MLVLNNMKPESARNTSVEFHIGKEPMKNAIRHENPYKPLKAA
jgi:hypothetical protein